MNFRLCLLLLIFLLVSCSESNSPDSQIVTNSIKQPVNVSNEKSSNEVILQLLDISNERAILEFSNNTDKPIYLFYSSKDKYISELSWLFKYSFQCRESGKKNEKYNEFTTHGLPSLEPLNASESFRFKVSPLPLINAECKVSVLYYDDERVLDIMDKMRLDNAEKEIIELSKKVAEVKFNLNANESAK